MIEYIIGIWKKYAATFYIWASCIGLLFLVGWCHAFTVSLEYEDFQLTSLDLEPNIVDNARLSKGNYSNFIRIGFESLDRAELDFDQFDTDVLDNYYGIQIKILFRNGLFTTSDFALQGLQLKNDLIIKGSNLHKRWHSTKEREALTNLSRKTVKAVYIRIYRHISYGPFPAGPKTQDDKLFTSFGVISRKEAEDYNYTPRN